MAPKLGHWTFGFTFMLTVPPWGLWGVLRSAGDIGLGCWHE